VVHLQIQTLSFECDSELLIITNSHKSTHRSKTLSRYGRVTISQRTVVINVQCPAINIECTGSGLRQQRDGLVDRR